MPEILAQAMMAVLPGIDANDSAKCLTVFNFLCITLSCLPQLPVGAPCWLLHAQSPCSVSALLRHLQPGPAALWLCGWDLAACWPHVPDVLQLACCTV